MKKRKNQRKKKNDRTAQKTGSVLAREHCCQK
jgi:hypothetical protein